jgi:hypothetical protein
MKSAARLLLVVALLLPFRGALAAAGLLCHMGGSSPATVSQAHEPGDRGYSHAANGHRHHGDDTRPASKDHAHHEAIDDSPDATGPAGGASTCDLCSSVCAAPPLPSHSAQLAVLLPATGERFPAVSPPRLAPTLGGLERPPRSV